MTCTCGNLQCYVCGENITGYQHFETPRKDGSKCVLHENDDQRLVQKIQAAQADAVKKVLEERGHELKEDDIKVDAPEVAARPAPPGPIGFGMPQLPGQLLQHPFEVFRRMQEAQQRMPPFLPRMPFLAQNAAVHVTFQFYHCLILGYARFSCASADSTKPST